MLLTALFCLVVPGAVAQGSGTTAEVSGEDFPIGTETGVDPFYPGDSSLTYQFPVKKLECGGKFFEARATVTYYYYPAEERYRNLNLCVFLKPLCTDYMKNPDYIAANCDHGTLVYHECFDLDGAGKKFKGSADAYSRAFSYYSPTVNDEMKLEYSAVFNAARPEKNSIEYKLSKSAWTEPNGNVYYGGFPGVGYFADWKDDVIRLDPFRSFNDYSPNGYWDDARLMVRLRCFNENVSVLYAQGDDSESSDPGQIKAYVDFEIRGKKDGKDMVVDQPAIPYYRSRENSMWKFALGGKTGGAVTLEESVNVRLGRDQRFLDSAYSDRYTLKFRAHAECCYNNTKYRSKKKRMYIRRATFTYMLYD